MSDIRYFDIDWSSDMDGPGTRVVLFLQGCHLDCAWCHLPHSRPRSAPLMFLDSQCLRCGACQGACELDIHEVGPDRHILNEPERCNACGACIRCCPSQRALLLPTRLASGKELYRLLSPQPKIDVSRNLDRNKLRQPHLCVSSPHHCTR